MVHIVSPQFLREACYYPKLIFKKSKGGVMVDLDDLLIKHLCCKFSFIYLTCKWKNAQTTMPPQKFANFYQKIERGLGQWLFESFQKFIHVGTYRLPLRSDKRLSKFDNKYQLIEDSPQYGTKTNWGEILPTDRRFSKLDVTFSNQRWGLNAL